MKHNTSLLILFALLTLSLAGCRENKQQILGDWILDTTITNGYVGFQLSANGRAASINQTRKQYLGWSRQQDRIVLYGKEFHNQRVLPFKDTFEITRITKDALWLRNDHKIDKYTKSPTLQ